MPSFTFEVINNKKLLSYNGNQYVYKNPLRDSSVLYKCVHPSCSATVKLDKGKTEIIDGTFTHARHSPLNPSIPSVSGLITRSRNSTPVTSRPAKGLYLPSKSPSSLSSSLALSPDCEFGTPRYKPPREYLLSVDRRRVSTSPSTIHSQSPVSESSLIDNHDQCNLI
uniref:FLYWCH-type domain-containing protein n=1 Tax=Cacopsylla melanoneura TaxID=428564 RepID=A0A8D8M7C4_9HEMI